MIGTWIAKRKTPAVFEALNKRDVEIFLKNTNPADDAKFVYPGDISASGTFVGKEAIRDWFERFFEQFPVIHFSVQQVTVANLFDMVGNNVVVTRWEVDVKNRHGIEGHISGVTVVTLRGGKVIHMQDFIFDTGEKFLTLWE